MYIWDLHHKKAGFAFALCIFHVDDKFHSSSSNWSSVHKISLTASNKSTIDLHVTASHLKLLRYVTFNTLIKRQRLWDYIFHTSQSLWDDIFHTSQRLWGYIFHTSRYQSVKQDWIIFLKSNRDLSETIEISRRVRLQECRGACNISRYQK